MVEVEESNKNRNVKVVVLGDIGRSPRMQYQSLALGLNGYKVDILGYGESPVMQKIKESPQIYYHFMNPCPQIPIKFLNYIFKTIWQSINLLFLLFITRRADFLLVQNPPAVPTLIICWIYCRIIKAKLIIDWHNYAYTIMALSVSPKNILVKITKQVELFIGQRADYNFCVSKAMQDDLLQNWNIRATVLYDKPSDHFKTISLEEKHSFIKKLGKKYALFRDTSNELNTVFTEVIDGHIYLKDNRPAFIVSSTSWTEDEDFSILFNVLQEYNDSIGKGNVNNLPNLLCVITGKGPLKEHYINKIAERSWEYVSVLTPWLELEDYPKLLASADLGISLHTSSSGVDLPMKVVDMFGCCLPVLAFDFKSLPELVKDGKNGFVFFNDVQLFRLLTECFNSFPNNENINKKFKSFKEELNEFQKIRWMDHWIDKANPIFN